MKERERERQMRLEGDEEKLTLLFFGKERQTNWQTDHRQTTALTTHTLTYTTTHTHIAGKEIPDINAN